MGGDIIAEKFALLRTRGSNGVAFTHIVEDTLLGQKAVVKVSDKLGVLGLDYLKTINLAREMEIPGMLMPFEGGILEEETGYYLAFPEVGEPSLENYLRIGVSLTCEDILGITGQVLHILEALHRASFFHLFLNTRNVFYRPRHGITLKDAALRQEYFHPLLELIAAPDFSYFSPEVMDGGMPGSGADLYALGRLSERLLEQASDADSSPLEPVIRQLAERCRSAGATPDALSAADLRDELETMEAAARSNTSSGSIPASGPDIEPEYDTGSLNLSSRLHAESRKRDGKSHGIRSILAIMLVLVLAFGLALVFVFTGEEERAPALERGGRSMAGGEAVPVFLLEATERPAGEGHASTLEDGENTVGASNMESAEEGQASASEPAVWEQTEAGPANPPAVAPPADPSPVAPVASFSVSPGEGQSPLQVYLDASSSYDPDGSIVSYAWSCGGSGRCLYHIFESNVIPATIPITLTVTDDGGHSSSATLCVTLY